MDVRRLGLILLLLILAGCARSTQPATTTPLAITVTLPHPFVPTMGEAVRTLVPSPTDTPTLPVQEAYPVAQPEATNSVFAWYPAPQEDLLPADESRIAAPFHDCARTPGLFGCGDEAVELAAALAVVDRTAGRLVALDLKSGSGWQTQVVTTGLAWEPGVEHLLGWVANEGGVETRLWSISGEAIDSPSPDQALTWRDDTLAPINTIYGYGVDYRLELLEGDGWVVNIRTADGKETKLVVDPDPADRQYLLAALSQTSGKMLLQSFYPTHTSMTNSGELLLVDLVQSETRPLAIEARLMDDSDNLAENPSRPGEIAFLVLKDGLTQLGLLDLETGQAAYPLPVGVIASSPDWSPAGSRLAFAAEPQADQLSDRDRAVFSGPGIYQLDLMTGDVELLAASPPSAQDGNPTWTADGRGLIFPRLIRDQQGETLMEIRALNMVSRQEVVLFTAIMVGDTPPEMIRWSNFMAVGR